ncbi:hypothetical protein [Pseudomonas moorei]|uniref:hypothetical protein n=1 Tax=Pseudomonas moorei TaxID=395599 RepID=UPI001FF1059B|nr:hypothetical protein [Pseudomonas moorei]
MTDLPANPSHVGESGHTFRQLMALKAQHQAEKSDALQAWKQWYNALNEEQKAAVDERTRVRCQAIAAQFGPSRRYRPLS